jgi:hypothetical protein
LRAKIAYQTGSSSLAVTDSFKPSSLSRAKIDRNSGVLPWSSNRSQFSQAGSGSLALSIAISQSLALGAIAAIELLYGLMELRGQIPLDSYETLSPFDDPRFFVILNSVIHPIAELS